MPDNVTFEPGDWLDREEERLAPYAMRTRLSRGRQHPEAAHSFRTPFQRDRDRIIHCTAFRRLMHKTQVLITHTNDHHRTRLTHTLEVVQLARTIARRARPQRRPDRGDRAIARPRPSAVRPRRGAGAERVHGGSGRL